MAQDWRSSSYPARLEQILPDGTVRCHLSPRNCVIADGKNGFCGVRGNRGGRLVSFNYGKSVHATVETIETEAVNHYSPGEPIFSLGNIGCMFNCAYCHNWKTSQARYVSDADVHLYTPTQVVETAIRHGIRCLSWTYNDPVVWHEFVRDTSALAQKAGLFNLYKSSFFITPEAVEELLPSIDIFSISIKSMSEEYYRRYTKGRLQPVLDATRKVYQAGKHVEISNLMITDVSDGVESARQVAAWVRDELDPTVPLHFVRFHPDYRMRNTTRTPIPRLVRAREAALEMGLQHVYLGNVYDTPYGNTYCRACHALLVERYGLNARIAALDGRGRCVACGEDAHVKLRGPLPSPAGVDEVNEELESRSFDWHGDIRSLHAQLLNPTREPISFYHRRRYDSGQRSDWRSVRLQAGESYRFIIAKGASSEIGAELRFPRTTISNLHEVFDRAHFPTVSIEAAGAAPTDVFPLPLYPGVQLEAEVTQRKPFQGRS